MNWQDTLTEVVETECYKRTILYQISAVLNLLNPSAPDSRVASLGDSGVEARLPNLPSARSPTSPPPATPLPAVVASAPVAKAARGTAKSGHVGPDLAASTHPGARGRLLRRPTAMAAGGGPDLAPSRSNSGVP